MKSPVALETTVITHGLPQPANLQIGREVCETVRRHGGEPKPIGFLDGKLHIGLDDGQLARLACVSDVRKISLRDLPIIGTTREHGGTTVSSTLYLSHQAGIQVFATGGLGGIHRDAPHDVSADLPALASIPGCVVCAGAKSILDLCATRERLETDGVTVLGWQCDDMPAFYCRESGLPVDHRVETAEDVAAIIRDRDALQLRSSIVVTVPCPADVALPRDEVETVIADAVHEAEQRGIRGKQLTPFLLNRVAEKSEGRSLAANRGLLLNNARVATAIATALH